MVMTPLVAGLFVFTMRVIDMSLDTLRLLFVMRGRKLLAGGIGVIQATVFILAVSAVLSGPLDPLTVAGYALGFGAGVIIGMLAEQRLALGFSMLRVYSPAAGAAIAERPARGRLRRHRVHRARARRRHDGDQLGHRPPRHRQSAGHRQADRS